MQGGAGANSLFGFVTAAFELRVVIRGVVFAVSYS